MKRLKVVMLCALYVGSAVIAGMGSARADTTYVCKSATFFKLDMVQNAASEQQVRYVPTTIVQNEEGYVIKAGGLLQKDRVLPFILPKAQVGMDDMFQLNKREEFGQVDFIGYGFKKPVSQTNDDFQQNLSMSIVFEVCDVV